MAEGVKEALLTSWISGDSFWPFFLLLELVKLDFNSGGGELLTKCIAETNISLNLLLKTVCKLSDYSYR